MRRIYAFNNHPLSEEMLLGLGGGVGFIYWHMKGTDPFLGGRSRGRPGQGFEACAGARSGVRIKDHITSSAGKAEKSLSDALKMGQPVMLQVDMGFLPYFDFGGHDYHFGAHVVVACGLDPASQQVLIADRDEQLHPVNMEQLAQARGSKYKPFPPKHRWYTYDFCDKRPPASDELYAAVLEQAEAMLDPPIRNMGVKGIRKAARRILQWPDVMTEDALRSALFNAYIFIDAKGGTGGGLFRYMFGRFLHEVAELTGVAEFNLSAKDFMEIGDHWQQLAMIFKRGWGSENPKSVLTETTAPLQRLADLEEGAWSQLRRLGQRDSKSNKP
jgi:hypothetical protein